jgi:hypothetical protein
MTKNRMKAERCPCASMGKSRATAAATIDDTRKTVRAPQ